MHLDADTVIGQLYREKATAEQVRDVLMGIIRKLKSGDLSLDQIEIGDNTIEVKPLPLKAVKPEGSAKAQ